ncbi:hypothetical protein [Streptomyces sp. NPDC053427]|uniref:hypothetical protein n=1 Tax=Streptomyces sp. NPDC053427 TaxID=3365701 RepID=UPI0037D7E91B
MQLEVRDVVAESYNRGHCAAVAELGAVPDATRRLVDEITPNAPAADRLAHVAVEVVTATHRGITDLRRAPLTGGSFDPGTP